ncbi:MAG: hypothetical protein LBR70_00055 [Lactobacillaceae bacterium]|jgi:hypothetical protein|nr:hypothetical protein [Lactobacillaceae bacterium]
MADEANFNTNNDENRPKLKKVKRPVKKFIGGGQGAIPPKSDFGGDRPVQSFNAPIKSNDLDAFNLDSYLDSDENASVGGNQFVTDEDVTAKKSSKLMVGNLFTLNFVILVSVCAFILGIGLTKLFSSGERVVQDGLQGVVINPEVPRGRARCGVAERTQGCVLYVMNPQRQELNARDFYDLAATLTGRQKFVIETGNIRYSNVKIKPGAIAQFNIPPLIN